MLDREANLIRVIGKVAIFGDLHGQLYDMFYIFDKLVEDPTMVDTMLFLGNYINRGMYSIEVFVYLCVMKLEHPESVILLRGNHESRHCSETYNFRKQCLEYYDEEVYELFLETFNLLPLAATVNGKYLAMHGGISINLLDLDSIDYTYRK